MRNHRLARRPGNVLILFAVLLTALVGMVAFALDTGYIALTKTELQRAADSAALAGAAKTGVPPGEAVDPAAVRAEVRRYVGFNCPGLTVRDADIRICRYNPSAPAGSRLSDSYSSYQPANCVQVTLRRDAQANGALPLFFAPVIGHRSAPLAVTSTSYLQSPMGVYAGAPLLPYTMQVDYYYQAMGQTSSGSGSLLNVLLDLVADLVTVNPTTLKVTLGPDGINEVTLFGDSSSGSGNFGSLDIGSVTNGTGELDRQILYGPTAADFQHGDFRNKVAPDGALYVPFYVTGDTGLSSSVKTPFEAIVGQPRIIPLYDTVTGSGDNAVYHIVGYAGVVVTSVNFTSSPKKVWVQPAFVVSNKVTSGGSTPTSTVYGLSLPPKLVIP